ncbi:hypothetical protein QFC19_001461 [Naganishia cerealis]|uniref:Uncharacterized protein n=1 Tax=Naganishia cerealis TaxID=610337 RepID=A0ACC2WG48_9TREE|nr:hypothetical protein QFC19_001461 [Naganishia cerealis]
MRRREQVFDWIAIFFTCVGSAGLILLSIFDAFNHSTIHWIMTIVFIVGVALSAIFQSAEIWSLHKDHPDRNHLKRNSVYKLIIVTIAVLEAIAFGSLYAVCSGKASTARCNRVTSGAAAMEWAVAFTLIFYWLSLVMDPRWQEKNDPSNLAHDFTGREAFSAHPEAWKDPKTGNAMSPATAGTSDARVVPVDGGNAYPDAPGYPSGYEQRMTVENGGRSGRPSTQYGSEAGLMRQV